MKNWRNTNGFADFSQSRSTIDLRGFGCQKASLAAGNGVASGGEHDDIMFEQFLDDRDMPLIQRGSGVVSPNHPGHTSYAAVDDIIIERHIGSPEGSTEVIVDGLVAEPGDQIRGIVGNHDLLFPVREVLDGGLHDLFGILEG